MQMIKTIARPKLHFAPQKNWINDPNGLVFFDDEWHLFYQYNPYGIEWGNMNWGHAVSKDLIHWQELGIAIKEDEENMIFSGSCVIDWHNTSGFGDGINPPMIAIYTDHKKRMERQVQSVAYSLDKGRTFTKYKNNPVIDIAKKDFRDPKVFWHQETEKWIMVVCNSSDNSVSIYNSTNLIDWQFKSEFGPAGIKGHLWECPDLFELKTDNASCSKWILKVDVFEAMGEKYSLGQAFIGSFDGANFVAEKDDNGENLWQRIDYGHDFYAAMSWSDVPQSDGRRIWTAWMNSHHYAAKSPASSWRGSMAIPRELSLLKHENLYHLKQAPITINGQIASNKLEAKAQHNLRNCAYELVVEIDTKANKDSKISLIFGENSSISFGYNAQQNEIYFDRSLSSEMGRLKEFGALQSAKRILKSDKLHLRAILDLNSIELFFDDGIQVFTETFYPSSGNFKIDSNLDMETNLELFQFETL